jgi:hypothetical protein
MAVLTVNSLDGCSSIPCFLPGTTRMTFNNSSAPTSWTKDTTSHNNKALRLVTGTRVPGGTNAFTTVFPDTARPIQGSIDSVNSNITIADETVSPVAIGQFDSFPSLGIQNATIAEAQLPGHVHTYDRMPNAQARTMTPSPGARSIIRTQVTQTTFIGAGSGGGHPHGFSATAQHNHPVTVTAHGHQITSLGPHNHTFSATAQNFAVSYADIIVAVKDSDPVSCSI